MPALAKYQVKPDFVIVVDPADFSYVLDDWDDLAGIKLIAEDSVHVSFLEKNFEEIYTVVTNKDSMGLDIYFGIPPMDLEGGTVPLATCSLAQQLQAASITLIGQDLTIGETNYFVAGGLHQKKYVEQNNKVYLKTSKKMEKGLGYRNDSSDVLQEAISVLGWNNETLYTSPEYYVYLSQFVNFASKINNVDLYNVSVGGANIKGFQNTILQDLIQKLPNNCSKLHKNSSKHITNVIHHQKFLIETRKDIINVLLQTRKAVSILERKNRIQDKKLGKLDNVEKKIIEISKNNEYISSVVSGEIIRLNRAVLYVTNLDDNLDLSLKFYRRMVRTFSLYQDALEYALKCIDGLSLIEDPAG